MRILSVMFLLFIAFNLFADQKAVTEEGDMVILHDDGTWVYEDGKADSVDVIKTNPKKFVKNKDSVFLLKSTKTNSAFWINPKKWSFEKNVNNHDSAEYTFNVKGSDLYGMVISEQIEVDVDELVKLAFNNAKNVAAGMKVVKKEYRVVNGNKVIYMEMEGTIQSIKFTYLGYYFSNSSGSTQFLTYTGSGLVDKYRADIDDLLNGFVIKNE